MINDTNQAVTAIKTRLGNYNRCHRIQNMLDVVSNPYRFKIICVLSEGDFPVSEIVKLVDGKVSNISQQLKILTLSGYLEKERRGKQIYYKLKDKNIKSLFDFLHTLKI